LCKTYLIESPCAGDRSLDNEWPHLCCRQTMSLERRARCDLSDFIAFKWPLKTRLFYIYKVLLTLFLVPSVIWCCWLGGRKGIWPVKKLSGGMLAWLCLGRGAD